LEGGVADHKYPRIDGVLRVSKDTVDLMDRQGPDTVPHRRIDVSLETVVQTSIEKFDVVSALETEDVF